MYLVKTYTYFIPRIHVQYICTYEYKYARYTNKFLCLNCKLKACFARFDYYSVFKNGLLIASEHIQYDPAIAYIVYRALQCTWYSVRVPTMK